MSFEQSGSALVDSRVTRTSQGRGIMQEFISRAVLGAVVVIMGYRA
jgi:hypothetical protein